MHGFLDSWIRAWILVFVGGFKWILVFVGGFLDSWVDSWIHTLILDSAVDS